MHDPMTVAFEIKYPWRAHRRRRADPGCLANPKLAEFERSYRAPFLTIWHVDPERGGSDDSCGWFMRASHGDKRVLAEIAREFRFHATWAGGWFDETTGMPVRSNHAIAMDMFYVAARVVFRGTGDVHGWRRAHRFMHRHLFDILHFAENPSDGLKGIFEQEYGAVDQEERIANLAGIVYGWILRADRPWYRHPKWHVWHWSLQCHPLQTFKRWAFSRCAGCRQRFPWGYAPVSGSWSAGGPRWFRSEPGVYHDRCFPQPPRPPVREPDVQEVRRVH